MVIRFFEKKVTKEGTIGNVYVLLDPFLSNLWALLNNVYYYYILYVVEDNAFLLTQYIYLFPAEEI